MAPQDSFIDDDDECPLCIEPLDLSDRNFRPCPCGYQICQFCFNNIKNNMNGLCPACRRPYDEKTIQWKVVTTEEITEFRANIQKNQKKRAAEQRQKEAQKREAEKENRKNLVGVRVVQKNLVYVTGLTPTVREDELLKTLRKPEFFGQYGNIQKISISNRKSSDGQNASLGIYVTFEKKEDAQRCIQAVNGSQNGDRVLKAQLGTTKYCSAWLRHETCSNRQCMFLHELGDEEDSYTRQDLSSMNSIHTQRPLSNAGSSSSRTVSRQQGPPPSSQPQPVPQPISQPMARSNSKEGSDNGDSSALPSSANWARNPQVRSRRGSLATSGAATSPAVSMSLPATAEVSQEAVEESAPEDEPVQPESSSAPSGSSSSAAEEPKPNRYHEDTVSLAKALRNSPFPFRPVDMSVLVRYPPLFDVRGGEKRRALREREELETRDSAEPEEVAEAPELSDGEPEQGGSLALGGEPEDREHGLDGHAFDQRRPGTQPPIQRTGTSDGIFGNAVGSSYMASSGAGAIGTRSMTPQQQQQLFSRAQSSFVDHYPPGITTGQSSLFQGQAQAHNRQGSRYSFANDNSSVGSTVKLSGNSRAMAQQASMMPTSSSFHSQPTSQYYATSIPGPPPGLKSTGTPPNLFGAQAHAFGSSSFGGVGASKDSNELLQSLMRGRGAQAGPAHDAGKREYYSSSLFSNQLPPSASSTPPPAPGPLGSFYGTAPGTFQDFGPRQSKKGKKQRHANTSSSGGGGLVDLADPSILRMQQQQHQTNANVGQGMFGGQSQDDELSGLDAAVTSNIEALVSDEPSETAPRPGSLVAGGGRSGTPSVPPGFGPPLASALSSPAPIQAKPTVPTPVATPARLAASAAAVPAATPSKKVGAEAKKNIKALAVESGLTKDIAAQAKPAKGKAVLQEEDFPALNAVKQSVVLAPAIAGIPKGPKATPVAKGKKTDPSTRPFNPPIVTSPQKGDKGDKVDKKPIPAVLNISAATKAAVKDRSADSSSATEKSATDSATAFPALPTPTAVAPAVTRAAPKTLRVVPTSTSTSTPKTELPQPITAVAAIAAATSGRSSVLSSQRPETPHSELISDSASVVSGSLTTSRPNSPPPALSRIGSAAVRSTTKSQQRKHRKQATKDAADLISSQPVPEEEEPVIAPILGRKKKQKKERAATIGSPATPVETRASTPASQASPVKEEPAKEVRAKEPAVEPQSAAKDKIGKQPTSTDSPKAKGKGKVQETETAKTMSTPPEKPPKEPLNEPDNEMKAETEDQVPTPAATLHDLAAMGLVDAAKLILLEPFIGLGHKPERLGLSGTTKDTPTPGQTSVLTDADRAALTAGKVVRKTLDGVRIMMTPNGDCLKHLTEEEEERFLKLQESVAATMGTPGFYTNRQYETTSGFSLVRGRAVPNGPPSCFPSPAGTQTDPVSKIQREDAITYINQYVLPKLSQNAQNAGNEMGSGKPRPGHMDATTAAASLSSIAPWIYSTTSSLETMATDGWANVSSDDPLLSSFADGAADYAGGAGPSGAATHQGQKAQQQQPQQEKQQSAPRSFSNVPLMSLEEAERALSASRQETEKIEKRLTQVMKKNRRILFTLGLGN